MLAAIVTRLEKYLGEALNVLGPYIRMEEQDDLAFIVLADEGLLNLPLEGLSMLQHPSIRSVTRDFGMQILMNRLEIGADADEDQARGGSSAKGKRESAKPPKGDKKKKKGCAELEPIRVPGGETGFALDPFADGAGCPDCFGLLSTFTKALKDGGMSHAKSWKSVAGHEPKTKGVYDRVPSSSELVSLLLSSSLFFLFGPGSLLSTVLPLQISGIALDNLKLAVLLDRVVTPEVDRAQSQRGVVTFGSIVSNSKETAAMLSLIGVNSVATNQWSCSTAENAERLARLLKDLTSEGGGLGKGIAALQAAQPSDEPDEHVTKKGGKKPKTPKTANKSKTPAKTPATGEPTKPFVAPRPPGFTLNTVVYGLPHAVVT